MTKSTTPRSLLHVAAVAVVLASGAWPAVIARAETDSDDAPHMVEVPVQESPAPQKGAPAAQEELGRIHIEYVSPKKPAYQKTYAAIKDRRVLERTREIFSPFRLPEELYIMAVECDGKPNTRFDRIEDRPTVRLCYEYLKSIYDKMPKTPTRSGITPREVLVGQFLFAAAHELGHALFDIYNIPIFGRQEDAADQFATYFILQFGGERARRLIAGAAYSYSGFVKQLNGNPKVTLPLAAFSSDHGQPEQRFYNLICIAYGYDPKVFAAALDQKWLPSSRGKVCELEYQNLRYAVKTLINLHIDQTLAQKVIDTGWPSTTDPAEPPKSAPQPAKSGPESKKLPAFPSAGTATQNTHRFGALAKDDAGELRSAPIGETSTERSRLFTPIVPQGSGSADTNRPRQNVLGICFVGCLDVAHLGHGSIRSRMSAFGARADLDRRTS